ncbi:cell division inhibitor [Klebsiella pneumoniae]|nr:cell division inhibitor [Klebsiella pneumoniae]
MKILLTGGTGLIGRHLIPRLLELGHSVTVSTRHPDTARARLDPRVTLWHKRCFCSAVQRLSAMGSPARLMTASMSLRW